MYFNYGFRVREAIFRSSRKIDLREKSCLYEYLRMKLVLLNDVDILSVFMMFIVIVFGFFID